MTDDVILDLLPSDVASVGSRKIQFDRLPDYIGIVGSRSFPSRILVGAFIGKLRRGTTVVSGDCATGVDSWAREYAEILPSRLEYHGIPADWRPKSNGGQLDMGAGIKRNAQLVAYLAERGGMLIAFGSSYLNPRTRRFSELSTGTKNVFSTAITAPIPAVLIYLDDQKPPKPRSYAGNADDYLI